MRTTINLREEDFDRLEEAAVDLKMTRHQVIGLLVSRITRECNFDAVPFTTVTYQEHDPDVLWLTVHVKFEPEIYEKCQDLRRHCKFSVSWFIAFAINNYIDTLVEDLAGADVHKIMDNYDFNYVYIAQMYGNIPGFLTLWGMPEEKYRHMLLV